MMKVRVLELLSRAIESPFRTICENAGGEGAVVENGKVLAKVTLVIMLKQMSM